ncbi:OmpA family protein [Bacteroidales bacterium OttesenSCG-928-B11]|nr:OmpA family protein [Bacteroidales bacterium OttesenSCG-928-B11]
MKKHLIIFSLIFSVLTGFAQNIDTGNPETNDSVDSTTTEKPCPHRINFYLGGSMTNNIFNRIDNDLARTNYSLGSVLEVKYAYFFNKNWGISLGVGVSNYATKATLNNSGVIERFEDADFAANTNYSNEDLYYNLHYRSNDIVEKQKIWAVEIPLQAQFEHRFKSNNGLYAGLGVKAFIPFSGKSLFDNEGTITTRGYEPLYNIWYQDMPNHFGTAEYSGKSATADLRFSVDMQFDFGYIINMSRRTDLYLGVYTSVGFMDILPKDKEDFVTTAGSGDIKLNPTMGSNYLASYNAANSSNPDFKTVREKWNLFQVGVKVGFHIKPCATNEPSIRDMKKKYYDEMAKKANDPIIIKNTEYVYIVPTCPDGYEDDEELTEAEKANIRELAEALSNTKILFDLDKDIPKVNDFNDNINRTVEILKKDKSLGLVIEGYTCDLGSEAHNRDLAQRRAAAVRKMFIEKGVDPNQISVAAYTVKDPENAQNIPQKAKEEHRAAIFRIIKR